MVIRVKAGTKAARQLQSRHSGRKAMLDAAIRQHNDNPVLVEWNRRVEAKKKAKK